MLFWVTNSKTAACQVLQLDNLNPKIVSTPAIDRFLCLGTSLATYTSFSFKRMGHRFYGITNQNANITMVYDIDQHLWYQWTDSVGNFYPFMCTASDPVNNLLIQSTLTGVPVYLDGDYVYPTDSGVVFPVDIYAPNFDAGVDRIKYLSQMRVEADQTPGSNLYVRYSENDYSSWTNYRKFDLSRQRPILNDEGSFYRRAYHFRHYAPTAFRCRAVDIQMDIGTL